jgi:protoporphyrinogen oxidase
MSPPGKTSLAFEFWCNEGDWMWNLDDETLIRMTLDDFKKLGMAPGAEKHIIGSAIVRCRKAYPMYVIGYEKPLNVIKAYLSRFSNLILIGRYGTFMYNNMDHCIETGIRAAENVMGASHDVTAVHDPGEYLEEKRQR